MAESSPDRLATVCECCNCGRARDPGVAVCRCGKSEFVPREMSVPAESELARLEELARILNNRPGLTGTVDRSIFDRVARLLSPIVFAIEEIRADVAAIRRVACEPRENAGEPLVEFVRADQQTLSRRAQNAIEEIRADGCRYVNDLTSNRILAVRNAGDATVAELLNWRRATIDAARRQS